MIMQNYAVPHVYGQQHDHAAFGYHGNPMQPMYHGPIYVQAHLPGPEQVQQHHHHPGYAMPHAAPLTPPPMAPTYDLETALKSVDEAQLRSAILQLAREEHQPHGRISSWLRACHHDVILAESKKVIDFDHYSKSVWYELNREYSHERGSRQYESAYDAEANVCQWIQAIVDETKPHSSFGTKKSALETLRKIGKSICLAGDTLGSEVRKKFQSSEELSDAMLHVIQLMSGEECSAMYGVDDNDGKGKFGDQFEDLVDLCEGHCIFENMRDVFDVFIGNEDGADLREGSDDGLEERDEEEEEYTDEDEQEG